MAVEAHFGGKCIDAGCIDGLRVPVKMGLKLPVAQSRVVIWPNWNPFLDLIECWNGVEHQFRRGMLRGLE